MEKLLTDAAELRCKHRGTVKVAASQSWVTVAGRPLLVEPDPVGKRIRGCPNIGPTVKPCGTTLAVERGYSSFVTIAGQAVCSRPLTGKTDGTPPGVVDYIVIDPGQGLVAVSE